MPLNNFSRKQTPLQYGKKMSIPIINFDGDEYQIIGRYNGKVYGFIKEGLKYGSTKFKLVLTDEQLENSYGNLFELDNFPEIRKSNSDCLFACTDFSLKVKGFVLEQSQIRKYQSLMDVNKIIGSSLEEKGLKMVMRFMNWFMNSKLSWN